MPVFRISTEMWAVGRTQAKTKAPLPLLRMWEWDGVGWGWARGGGGVIAVYDWLRALFLSLSSTRKGGPPQEVLQPGEPGTSSLDFLCLSALQLFSCLYQSSRGLLARPVRSGPVGCRRELERGGGGGASVPHLRF